MKRILVTSVIATLAGSFTTARRCDAVIVECANCSTIIEQLLSDAKQAQQLATQIDQYRLQGQQYANMVQNSVALPQEIWANVSADIMQVRSLANAASLLTGNSGTILTRLQSAQGYAGQATFLPQNISTQFTMWQQTLGNASASLGRTLGVQQGQENNYTALQTAIQAHSQTAAGQMQAIQAGNELAALTNTQLNQIQTTLVSAAQQQAARNDVYDDRQAARDQAMLNFLHYQPVPTTGSQGF